MVANHLGNYPDADSLTSGNKRDGLTGKPSRLFGEELPFNTVSQILNFAVVALMAIAVLYAISSYCYTMSAARLITNVYILITHPTNQINIYRIIENPRLFFCCSSPT